MSAGRTVRATAAPLGAPSGARHLIRTGGLLLWVGLGLACGAAREEGRRFTGPTLAELRERAQAQTVETAREAGAVESSPDPDSMQERHLRGAALAPPRIAGDDLHALELRGATLGEAVHLISSMAGVNVLLDPRYDAPVDASFPAVTLDDALTVLLEQNDLALVERPAGVFFVESRSADGITSTVFELQAIRGEDVLANVQLLLGQGGQVAHDPNQNFLVVRAAAADVETVGEYLARADRLKPQVLIEMQILEVILDDTFELGVRQLLSDPDFLGETTLDLDTNLGVPGDAFTGVLSLNDFDFDLTIEALSTYGAVEVVSSPRVLAITKTEAKIEVVTEIPYVETTSTIDTTGTDTGLTSQETVAFKEAGIKLSVTPTVQDGDVVQLDVTQVLSEVVDFFQGVPVLDTRTIGNQFLVQDQDAVVIGGLIQDRETQVDRGVPVLMHLPLVGRLFRSDQDVTQRRELLVLITPRVLDPKEAARLTQSLRADYSERRRLGGLDPADAAPEE